MVKATKSVVLSEEENRCGYLDSVYEETCIRFALAVPTIKGKIMLTTTVNSCREELACEVQNKITKKGKRQEFKKTHVVIFASSSGTKPDAKGNCGPYKTSIDGKGRYSFSYDEWMKRIAIGGLKIVNHFEKRNKWLQSKAYKVILPRRAKLTKHAYYFVGSRWWVHTPHNLSLYLLLIRLGRFEIIQKLRKNMSRKTFLKALKDTNVKSYGNNLLSDASVWYPLTKNMKRIYSHHKGQPARCWEIMEDYTEGIYDFVNGDTSDDAAYSKLCKILAEARRQK